MAKEGYKAGREARDPSSRCGECAHRRTRQTPDGFNGFNGFYCGCWNVRGGDGTGYRRVSLKDPACRHFVPQYL